MLRSVHIENVALIKCADIELGSGFSCFTGETGAGKSILIDSIGFACGAKVSKEIIRSGEEFALVELMFCDISEDVTAKLDEIGVAPDEDGAFFIRRVISTDGKTSVKINSRSVPLSVLKSACAYLLNINGQHDNVRLMDEEKHIHMLDSFAKLDQSISEYSKIYSEYTECVSKLEALDTDEQEKQRRIDMLKFQITDIEGVNLVPGESEKLEAEKKILRNSEKIIKGCGTAYGALYDNPNGTNAYENIDRALSSMKALIGVIEGTDELYDRLESIKYDIEDISERIDSYRADMSEDPTSALDRIETRLDVISKLKRKYGSSEQEILDYLKHAKTELSEIDASEEKKTELLEKKENLFGILDKKARLIREKRQNAAETLCERVEAELGYLDMPNVRFKAAFEELESLSERGLDKVYFTVRMNSGEPFTHLSSTASGGELSRIMLALRCAFSVLDGVGTLIFDEIDTGISGKTSRRVGLKLRSLSNDVQILCVTHSAQVASLANTHYLVSKRETGGRTLTAVETLGYDERINETARIIAGIDITDNAKLAARELIENISE